jgi:beta-galactosidase
MPSRRAVLRTGTFGGAALISLRALGRTAREPWAAAAASRDAAQPGQPAVLTAATGAAAQPARDYDFNQGWLFGGVYVRGSEQPGYNDSGFAAVTLPHTVTPLSWGDWDHTAWENVWIYRKHFEGSAVSGGRVFVDFDAVMTNAAVVLTASRSPRTRAGTCRGPPN